MPLDTIPGAVPPDNAELAALPRNDSGNAERLVARFGHEMAWVPGYGWRIWDGRRWVTQEGVGAAYSRGVKTAKAIFDEADELPAKPEPGSESKINHRAAHQKWSKDSGNIQRIRGMLDLAASELERNHRDFDADPYQLNVANGTLALGAEGVSLQPHCRADYISRIADVEYHPEADCPSWRAFIDMIFPDPDTQRFVQKWFGYSLTGSTIEQLFVVFSGKGANGKSTMIDTIARIMGSYAGTVPVEALLAVGQKSSGGPSPEIVKMNGPRLVRTSEPYFGAVFNDSVVKQLTGSEEMTGRGLAKDYIDFHPVAKLCLGVNHVPRFKGRDHGTKRRTIIVPCRHQFKRVPGEKKRDYIGEFVANEASGILNWLLDGFRLWAEEGLMPEVDDGAPDYVEIREQTKSYFTDLDQEGQALREILILTNDPDDKVSSSEIAFRAEKWCKENADRDMRKNLLTDALKAFGAESCRLGGGIRAWRNVIINPELSENYSPRRHLEAN